MTEAFPRPSQPLDERPPLSEKKTLSEELSALDDQTLLAELARLERISFEQSSHQSRLNKGDKGSGWARMKSILTTASRENAERLTVVRSILQERGIFPDSGSAEAEEKS